MEEYRNVTPAPYDKVYEVSDEGNVKSLGRYVDNNGTLVWFEGRIMKGYTNKYRRNERRVFLCYEGVKKSFKIHHLVAWAFPEICGEWFEGAEVDHINGNPQDNRALNLRVTDRKGNMANPNTREKMRNGWDDIRRKEQSERMKGKNNPANRCMTDEWKIKIAESQTGKKRGKYKK